MQGLTAKDFHLFEDGQEQAVQSVKPEPPAFQVVRDNLGKHPETIGSGGGRWGYPDQPETYPNLWLSWPQYVIAYIPPVSPPASCHKIQVKVGRPNSIVWTSSEYCNTKQSATTDPLKDTEFGKQLEAALTSPKEGKINLALQVAAFYSNPGVARVNVTLEYEYPWHSLKHEFKNGTLYATIGALVMVYNKDGTLAARYSDFACCDYGDHKEPRSKARASENLSIDDSELIPNRYETQFDLAPGEYDVRAVFSDGENFGTQQMPLTVDNYDAGDLTISHVALSRRVRKVMRVVTDVLVGQGEVVSGESSDDPDQPPDSSTALISKGVEFTPTADTRFSKDEMLYAYFEVNDPRLAGQSGLTIQVDLRILDAKSGGVKIDFQPVDAAPYIKEDSSLFRIGREITLAGLPSGAYRLEVQATDSAGKSTAWRTASFTIDDFSYDKIRSPVVGAHRSQECFSVAAEWVCQ